MLRLDLTTGMILTAIVASHPVSSDLQDMMGGVPIQFDLTESPWSSVRTSISEYSLFDTVIMYFYRHDYTSNVRLDKHQIAYAHTDQCGLVFFTMSIMHA